MTKVLQIMFAVAVALVCSRVNANANAASVEWYADHIELAKSTQATCNARLRKRETLSEDVLGDCRHANEAMLHAHTFTASKPVNW